MQVIKKPRKRSRSKPAKEQQILQMKTTISKPTMLVALALALSVAFTSVLTASEKSQVDYKKILSKVPPPELAAKAAELVSKAPAAEQKTVAIAVVRAAVKKNPTAAPMVVGAVAKAVPAVAGVAAATAVALEPKQAGLISKAATTAAPSRAGEIVSAICKEMPSTFRIVAIGASEAAPAANAEILAAVSQAIPPLKPYMEQAGKAPLPRDGYASSMVGTLQHAESLATSAGVSVPAAAPTVASIAPPPPQRPPFTPAEGKPGEANRAQTVVVQPGVGRIYSAP